MAAVFTCEAPTEHCVSDCPYTFEILKNTLTFGGSRGSSSLSDCESACLGSDVCHGFDFDHSLPLCYIHPEGFQANAVSGVTGVDQYRKIASCAMSKCIT